MINVTRVLRHLFVGIKTRGHPEPCLNFVFFQFIVEVCCNMALVFFTVLVSYLTFQYSQKIFKRHFVAVEEKCSQTGSDTKEHSTQTNRRFCTRLMHNRHVLEEITGEGNSGR